MATLIGRRVAASVTIRHLQLVMLYFSLISLNYESLKDLFSVSKSSLLIRDPVIWPPEERIDCPAVVFFGVASNVASNEIPVAFAQSHNQRAARMLRVTVTIDCSF